MLAVSILAAGTVSRKVPLNQRVASPQLDWKTRFRIIASKASLGNRNPNVYSTTEEPIRNELLRLGFSEGSTFYHEYRIPGYIGKRGQSVYYWMDFYFPDLKLAIEADGEIWHTFFDTAKRDRTRDRLIARTHGIKVARLNSRNVRVGKVRSSISRIIFKRCIELLVKTEQKNAKEIVPTVEFFLSRLI